MASSLISIIRRYWYLYIIAFAMVFGIKYFGSKAGVGELDFILAPTARFVSIITGHAFEKESYIGYVNHHVRFIIAPVCSGLQFLNIAFATLAFSFLHRMKTMQKGILWISFSLWISYIYTIVINGFRISLSVFHRSGQGTVSGWLSPERLHLIEGTAIYFTALLVLYHAVGWLSAKISHAPKSHLNRNHLKYCIPPLFWYFAITLAVPALNRAYINVGEAFTEYAIVITAVCIAAVAICVAVRTSKQRM